MPLAEWSLWPLSIIMVLLCPLKVIFPKLTNSYTLKLHLKRKNEELPEVSDGNRLVWCPYVVDGDDDDDENMSERVLALNVGRVAEVLDIDVVISAHGDTVHVENITKGIVRVQRGHTKVSLTFAF